MILSLALTLGAHVNAIYAIPVAPELVVRDAPENTIDCGYCTGMLDFCFQVSLYSLALY